MRKKKGVLNRIKFLKDKMTLMTKYKDHFVDNLGRKGYVEEMDMCLDELKILFIELEKTKKDENK